jgi:hypothetical protein
MDNQSYIRRSERIFWNQMWKEIDSLFKKANEDASSQKTESDVQEIDWDSIFSGIVSDNEDNEDDRLPKLPF